MEVACFVAWAIIVVWAVGKCKTDDQMWAVSILTIWPGAATVILIALSRNFSAVRQIDIASALVGGLLLACLVSFALAIVGHAWRQR